MNSSIVVKTVFAFIIIFFVGLGGFFIFYPDIPKTPGEQIAVLVEAEGSFNENDLDGAIKNAERILKADSENVMALLALASSWVQKGSIEFKEKEYGQKAIETAQQVLALDPENAEAYRIIGYANEIMEEYDKAFVAYDAAIGYNPEFALAISQKGHAYDLLGDIAKAKQNYQKALLIDSTLDHALINMARISMEEDSISSAISFITTLLASTDNNRFLAEGHQILGLIALQSGDFASATSHFEESLDIDPALAQSLIGLAEAKYYTLPDITTAEDFEKTMSEILQSLERAIEINPNNSVARIVMAKSFKLIGDTENAKNILTEALSVVGNDIALSASQKDDVREIINSELENI